MSEYQYYEFQAIDRPLDRAAQQALRSISSRARITATSFTNHYEWGDFKGDPRKFMERWFDLHVYLANWGTRRLMIRVPKCLVDRKEIGPFLQKIDWVRVRTSGDNLIIDIHRHEVGLDNDWDDGSGWLGTLAPLRAAMLSGDLTLFYLVWLAAVKDGPIADNEAEPLSGIGPLTRALEGFATFFGIDPDLVQAAAEDGADETAVSEDDLRNAVAGIPEPDKVQLLLRVANGDPHVGVELKNRFRKKNTKRPRTVAALRARAQAIAVERERAAAKRLETRRRREAAEVEKARRARLNSLKQRGADVWREVEEEILRGNSSSYGRAADLLSDLQALAVEQRNQNDFKERLAAIRARHHTKRKFIERLRGLGRDNDEGAT